jgi:hypothetical protein
VDEPKIIVVRVGDEDRAEREKQRKATTRLAIDTIGWLRFVQGMCLAYALIMLIEWIDEETKKRNPEPPPSKPWAPTQESWNEYARNVRERQHGDVDARPLSGDN